MPEWEQALERAAATPDMSARRTIGRGTVLETAAFGVRWSGAPLVARHVNAYERAGIVVYHDPTPDTVERHLKALSRRHRFVTLDEVVGALYENAWDEIPPKAIAVTIDDGFARNADLAEIFAAFGVVPTVFICPAVIESRQPFWWTLPGLDVPVLKHVPNEVRLAAVEQALEACPRSRPASPAEIAASVIGSCSAHTPRRTRSCRCAPTRRPGSRSRSRALASSDLRAGPACTSPFRTVISGRASYGSPVTPAIVPPVPRWPAGCSARRTRSVCRACRCRTMRAPTVPSPRWRSRRSVPACSTSTSASSDRRGDPELVSRGA